MTSIEDFYENNKVPDDFDPKEYAMYIYGIEDFYEPYCKNHGISESEKYYFHCKVYGDGNYKRNNSDYYKPPERLDDEISVVVGCMDREKMLSISIQSWIQVDSIKEIIITDWSSQKSIKHFESLSPKIKIIRVDDKKYYNASTPVNIAMKQAKYDKLMKLDTDYIINPYGNFNDLANITENEFICGDHTDSHLDNHLGFVRGLNGFLCIHKKNMEKVGYYDESIENYGVEDCQMFKRLMKMGLTRKTLKFDPENIPIFHSPHSNYFRCEKFEQKHILYNYKKYGNPLV